MIANLHSSRSSAAQPGGAGARRPGAVRRADARALGAQEAALRRDEQRADRRVVRAGAAQRRAGRQADRRGRRRLPDVLRRGSQRRLRHAMAQAGLEEVRFRFDFEGTKVPVLRDVPVAILLTWRCLAKGLRVCSRAQGLRRAAVPQTVGNGLHAHHSQRARQHA